MMTSGKKSLILSPHLDDAVFSIGGSIATVLRQSSVITFFAGKPNPALRSWWDKLCGFKDSDQAITARYEEDKKAFSMLGVSDDQLHYRSYEDIQYRQTKKEDSITNREVIKTRLIQDIHDTLEALAPETVYFPLMRYHPDHKLLSDACVEVFKSGKHPTVTFNAYEDLPYAFYFQIFHPFCAKNKIARHVINDPAISMKTIVVSLTRETFTQKLQAIQAYSSQFVRLQRLLLWIVRVMARNGNSYQETLYELSRNS